MFIYTVYTHTVYSPSYVLIITTAAILIILLQTFETHEKRTHTHKQTNKHFTVLSLASIKLAVAITLLRSITYCPGVSLAVLFRADTGTEGNPTWNGTQ